MRLSKIFFKIIFLLSLLSAQTVQALDHIVLPLEEVLVQGVPRFNLDQFKFYEIVKVNYDFYRINPYTRELLKYIVMDQKIPLTIVSKLPLEDVTELLGDITFKDGSKLSGQYDIVSLEDFSRLGKERLSLSDLSSPLGQGIVVENENRFFEETDKSFILNLGKTFFAYRSHYDALRAIEGEKRRKARASVLKRIPEKELDWFLDNYKPAFLLELVQELEAKKDFKSSALKGFLNQRLKITNNSLKKLKGSSFTPFDPNQTKQQLRQSEPAITGSSQISFNGIPAKIGTTAYLEADPSVRAFLDTIATAEGTNYLNSACGLATDGYGAMFSCFIDSDRVFSDFTKHPESIGYYGPYASSAAGRYQFLTKTWDWVSADLNLLDMSPRNQDLAAIRLLRFRNALSDVKTIGASNKTAFIQALNKSKEEWASLPGSPYGQPTQSINDLWWVYRQAYAFYTKS